MLKLDLRTLEREGVADVTGTLAPDDPLWNDVDLQFEAPVTGTFRATRAGTGEVVVRGRLRTRLLRDCRRCALPLSVPFDREITVVFAPRDEWADADEPGMDDSDVRELPEGVDFIDLGPAMREELILSLDPFEDCPEREEGLCNRGREYLDFDVDRGDERDPDPRWAALEGLKNRTTQDTGSADDGESAHD